MSTSKEIVLKTLEFKNPERVPNNLWTLKWAELHYPGELEKIKESFVWDFEGISPKYEKTPKTTGDMDMKGTATDAWGCVFENRQDGVIGEVKNPLVTDDGWKDVSRVHIPAEWLTFDIDDVNRQCDLKKDKFISGGCCPRPFEQMQFIRGTENLYMDLMFRPPKMMEFMTLMHEFYCELMEKWARTNVDYLFFMDDWGSQKSLLINPKIWIEIFKPLYKDYVNIAHRHGKKIFMHSDGYILDIYPHLIELGVDALNSQIFCMGIDNLAQFRGKITFWGEIDRQGLLPNATVGEINTAVKHVKSELWESGGCIAQCEFGPGGKPENVAEVFRAWNEVSL